MTSIGNDIVALDAIDIQRTIQPRFYSKIITKAEFDLHEPVALPFYHFVWLLWSVKEAAYKYMARLQPGLVFSLMRTIVANMNIPVAADEYITAHVAIEGVQLQSFSKITADYIISFVHTANVEAVQKGIHKIEDTHPDNQSAMVRHYAINKLLETCPGYKVEIDKNMAGVPVVLLNGVVDEHIVLSLAHHGQYVCYAFVAESL